MSHGRCHRLTTTGKEHPRRAPSAAAKGIMGLNLIRSTAFFMYFLLSCAASSLVTGRSLVQEIPLNPQKRESETWETGNSIPL